MDAHHTLKAISPTGLNTQIWDIVPDRWARDRWKAVSLIQLIIRCSVTQEVSDLQPSNTFAISCLRFHRRLKLFRPTWDFSPSIMPFFKPNAIGSNKKSIRLIKMHQKKRTPYIKSD